MSDVTIDLDHTRIALITFSSAENVMKNVDGISVPRNQNNKCLLLNKQLSAIKYTGGETFTLGAFQIAKKIFENSRNSTKKIVFLITDGFSNGGDPIPVAEELKKLGTTIFTIGIRNGNYKELYKVASEPGEIHSYLLDSFEEFESLARKALHVDLKVGDYIPLGINSPCDSLCKEGDCCDQNALCTCGTSTGHYSCICPAGYYGSGLKDGGCSMCPVGFYSDGPNLCTPCPDAFHTTKPPAYGKNSCKCKVGYKATNNTNRCTVVKCNKLAEPEHGYFVKKTCDVVINSACGARCEVGYNLVGTSIRLCQNDGNWTGIAPSCQVRTCEKLSPPAFGSMSCSHTDLNITYDANQTNYPVDTVSMCREVKCNKIPPIAHAKIEPKSCNYGKQAYGKKCIIKCKEGFEISGPRERSCTKDLGNWDTKENSYCNDVTPPKINCPKEITGSAKFSLNYGFVIWEAPTITDNSNDELIVWTKPPIANLSDYKFFIGTTNVSYFAEDSLKNRGECTTTVTILDEERPTIENCINPSSFLSEDGKGANVTWDEPYIHDNSHHAKITRSHNFGYFVIGTTTITYTAVDDSGNKNLCQMNITVREAKCDDFQAPYNGRSECSKINNTLTCIASCNEGFSIPSPSNFSKDNNITDVIVFSCNATENFWYNEEGLSFPECSVNELPTQIIQNGTIEIEPDFDCVNEPDEINEIENDLKNFLSKEVCTENCSVSTKSECIGQTQKELEEEETNIIKRDTSKVKSTQKSKSKKRRKKLKVNIIMKGKYSNTTQIFSEITHGNSSIYFGKPQFVCPVGYIPRRNKCVQCPKGTFQIGEKCENCGFGFFNSRFGQISCTPCPLHFSTRKLRAKSVTDCEKQCHPGTHAKKKIVVNSRRHRKKIVERPTLQPFCKSCPIGFYQDEYGQLQCIPCPKGFTTHGYGSSDVGQCVETAEEICIKSKNICNYGTCVAKDRIHYECNCFEGYIGSHCEKRIDVCQSNPCQNGGSCVVVYDNNNQGQYKCLCYEDFFGSLCEHQVDRCKLKCFNGGTCIELEENEFVCLCPEGYEGELCQSGISYCESGVCENNGTCLEKPTTYACQCPKEFIGKRCHLRPCDYKPCPINSICQNKEEDPTTIHSYGCICLEGWTGKACDVKLSFCSPNPCQNNGTCVNERSSFRCMCPQPFFGSKCEEKRSSDYIIAFEGFKTSDFIRLPPFEKDLEEITVCMWLKVTDTFNYGTLVSYATRENDNAFTLTDYTGLIMYVNGQYIATDVSLNDGVWHHVCATWRSNEGIYQVYIDGNLRQFGSGLSKNIKISAYGSMIIGQEQDVLGGRFSQSETFVGKMSYIDFWSKVLTREGILRHYHDCQNPSYGNLYSWTDIQYFIQGNVKKEPSQFCNQCPAPKKIKNGVVEVRENSAYYSCNEGYRIGNDYKNGRKCLKSSKWEGQREPYCRRVYCGPPGFLKNGFIEGSNYYFEDTVNCGCISGYNLLGVSKLTCGKTGIWEPSKPKCVGPQCKAFKIPTNGNITIFAELSYGKYKENATVFDVGAQIEVKCDDDATLVGESVITCQDNGNWDYQPPICVLPPTTTEKVSRCSLQEIPLAPKNGRVKEESLESYSNELADFVVYSCDIGFQTVGVNISHCMNGYWSEMKMSCKRIQCEQPENIENGIILSDRYYFEDSISFACHEGYILEGKSVSDCRADGSWSAWPKCIKVSCGSSEFLENGKVFGNSHYFGDEIIFECNAGYHLIGSISSSCTRDGIWRPPKPTCIAITTTTTTTTTTAPTTTTTTTTTTAPTTTTTTTTTIAPTTTITTPPTSTTITTHKAASTKPSIRCNHPKIPLNMLKIGDDSRSQYSPGNRISFTCAEGYKMLGNNFIVCTRLGRWSRLQGKCRRISCRQPEVSKSTKIVGESYLYEDIVVIVCRNKAKYELKCSKEGIWEGPRDSSC
ncbi:hypothetical protein HHI36_010286 [Cryptolaemus montrouzieri]|uniref:Sushi, von Willebrand factor type A, EGF and pentraxin domain-containing protein 1 n=1 Tax=Cryptolaemus montrouzieri TaxID=559131 RepID=A0ABD2MID7_9CUCU